MTCQQGAEPVARAKRVLLGGALIAAVLFLVFAAYYAVLLVRRGGEAEREAVSACQNRVARIAARLDRLVEHVEQIATKIADDLQAERIAAEMLLPRLKEDIEADRMLLGLGVAYEPFEHTADERLVAPLCLADQDEVVQLGEVGDYTSLDSWSDAAWFVLPMLKREAMWTSGVAGLAGDEPYVALSVPFFASEQEGSARPRGVVVAVVGMRDLAYLINSGYVGRLGGGFLTQPNGRLLAHSMENALGQGWTLHEVAEQTADPSLGTVAAEIASHAAGVVDGNDPRTGDRVLHFYRALSTTGGSVGMTAYYEEVSTSGREVRRYKIKLALAALGLITSLAFLGCRAYRLGPVSLWVVTTLYSLLAAGVIAFVWQLTLEKSLAERRGGETSFARECRLIDDQHSLEDLIDDWKADAESSGTSPPTIVRTGVFVNAIDFESSNDVRVSGMIWRRHPVAMEQPLDEGIVFPDLAPDGEAIALGDPVSVQDGEFVVVQRRFRVVLRLPMRFAAYPFDRQRIPIRVRYPDSSANVVFLPDLDAYDLINTKSKPGVSTELVLPGWQIDGSYFALESDCGQGDFGVRSAPAAAAIHDLVFSVLIRREITTPFLSHVFPLIVVATLLFGVLISSGLSERSMSLLGFSTFGVLQTCGAFFFAIIFVHIDMRAALAADVITYLESLHLILYVVLLLVSLDVLLFTLSDAFPILEYRENLVAKLFYWPTIVSFSLAATVYFFY